MNISSTNSLIILLLGTIFIIMIIIFFLTKFKILTFNNKIDSGNLLTIIALVVACFGLYVSFNSFIISENKYRIDNLNQRDEKLQQQAVQVAAWIDDSKFDKQNDPYPDNTFPIQNVTIENASSVPVYNVFLFSISNSLEKNINNLNLITKGDQTGATIKYIEILKPGTIDVLMPSNGPAMGGEHDSIAMIFRDTSSNYWFRSNFGVLTHVKKAQVDALLKRNIVLGPYKMYN